MKARQISIVLNNLENTPTPTLYKYVQNYGSYGNKFLWITSKAIKQTIYFKTQGNRLSFLILSRCLNAMNEHRSFPNENQFLILKYRV